MKTDGFVFLKSLITLAVTLACIAGFVMALAIMVRQSGHLGNRITEEFALRNNRVQERLK